ncbi:hypothetical protein KC19_11G099600 [Ceratodon purpureus]|uniref:AP2/ERF domain-containing protein n=1 Tax=Ceratodon purpureus TaxID=3225 RepID=A0A8T0GEV6_CERPU|nr:hypothetical protein KC19_11G099600 [Ceratodon purpureus]
MTKCQSSIRSEDGKPQIKYKGIHEPKGRVKGYRVEIRPPNSQKIWVGTFDTRPKAMRAFDAAVYLTGKEPYYYEYPENYFPTRPNKPSREFVQTEAKKYADRTDDLKVNPSSFLVDTHKAGLVEASSGFTSGTGNERITFSTPNVKEMIFTPLLADFSKSSEKLLDVEEFLQNAEVSKNSVDLPPALDADFLWHWDLPAEEAKSYVGEAKLDMEEAKKEAKASMEEAKVSVKEAELAAFDRGYNDPDLDALTELFCHAPPEFFPPCIEGESFIPIYSPSRPASKRKRDATEGAIIGTDDCKNADLSESGATALEYEWWQNLDFDNPMKQSFDWPCNNDPLLWFTNGPVSSCQ